MEYEWEVTEELLTKLVEEGVISRSEAKLAADDVEALNASIRNFQSGDPTAAVDAPGSGQASASRQGKRLRGAPPPVDPLAVQAKADKTVAEKKFNKAKTEALSLTNKMRASMPSQPCNSLRDTADSKHTDEWGHQK